MKNKLDKLLAQIGREFSTKPKNIMKFLFALLVFNFFAFGYFGVYVGYRSYIQKWRLLSEMRTLEDNLLANDMKLTEIGPYINYNSGVTFISDAIPDISRNWDYMVTIANVASENFMQLQSITFSKNQSANSIPITIRLQGDPQGLGGFLADVEALKRLSSINAVSYSPFGSVSGIISVSINLDIYANN